MLSNLCHVLCQKECFGSYLYFFLTINEMIVVLLYPAEILGREMNAANGTPYSEAMVRLGDDSGSLMGSSGGKSKRIFRMVGSNCRFSSSGSLMVLST
jgi:hypothetical protein